MVTNEAQLHTLTSDEKQSLLDIVNEQFGSHLDFEQFADVMLGLFENVAGFETIPRATANRFVHQLWRKYYEQNRCQEVEQTRYQVH